MINKFFKNTKYVLIILLGAILNEAYAINICTFMLHKHTLPNKSTQVLIIKKTDGFFGKLYVCEKNTHIWQLKKIIPILLGRNGIISASKKYEGDGYTPSGFYNLGPAFGQKNINTKMPFIKLNKDYKWIDDPLHKNYNQLIVGKTDAATFENMFIPEYFFGIVVQYNMHPIVKNKGSAIFIHIWHSPVTATSGCIAMAQSNIEWLLGWLNINQQPIILI
jgi:L,D-peptidoglycan transpeptidase YkuD (ErfK/YbiS/YcfS/YnhG family)